MTDSIRHTKHPPTGPQPVFIWDGSCAFCGFWVERWKAQTGERVIYSSYQIAASLFPDIPRENFSEAVHLIEPSGRIYRGAEAIFRVLSFGASRFSSWVNQQYNHSEWFRGRTESGYRWVARNRTWLWRLTRLIWGSDGRQPKQYWIIYMAALLSGLTLLWALS